MKLRTESSKLKYFEVKKTYNQLLTTARNDYLRIQIDSRKKDIKSMYKVINKALGTEVEAIHPTHKNPQLIANEMTKFFENKINLIRENINCRILGNEDTFNATLDNQIVPVIESFVELSIEEVKDIIIHMNSKHCFLDPLPTWLLKECIDELLPLLTHIINTSLSTSVFPNTLKHASISPIQKDVNSDPNDYSNYRPVSNTAFVAKILEKAALNQINQHIETWDLHASTQSGYRKYHSCETALLKVVNDMNIAIDSGQLVVLVLLDLSAAFDTVDHGILLDRLKNSYSINGPMLSWIESYLIGRTFSVKINNSHGQRSKMAYGVPQGSLLGPLLFILYTKEISSITTKYGMSVQMYADDTQLYVGFEPQFKYNSKIMLSKIELCLKKIKSWMSANFLKLNSDKTDVMYIGTKNNLRKFELPLVKFDGTELISSSVMKTLGVKLDATLDMVNDINQRCSSHTTTLETLIE